MDQRYPGIVLASVLLIGLAVFAFSSGVSAVDAPTSAALSGTQTQESAEGSQAADASGTGSSDTSLSSEAAASANSVSGVVFNDADNDGVRDESESGLAGWTIQLSGDATATTVSDTDGFFEFTGLADGSYQSCVVLQSGFTTSITCVDVTISANGSSLNNNFAIRVVVSGGGGGGGGSGNGGGGGGDQQAAANTGSISGKKYLDFDGDNTMDANEPGLSGWTINLASLVSVNGTNTTSAAGSATTGADGSYSFANLAPGTYVVSEVAQSGFSVAAAVTVVSNNDAQTVNIGNAFFGASGGLCVGSIAGMKFNDLNGNGLQDVNETGLAGWTITATGPVNASAVTGADGRYVIGGLPSGTYTVREVLQADWRQTTPNPAPQTIVVPCDVNFGNQIVVGSISGVKFKDLNANGVRDAGEPGLFGWTIQLSGRSSATTTTGADGSFTFTGLLSGTYVVTEVQQEGWVQTTPNPAPINLSGQDVTGVLFGNVPAMSSISGLKFHDLDGDGVRDLAGNATNATSEPGLAGWTIFLDSNGNGALDAGETNTVTGADGSFSFQNLAVGTYTVREVQQEGWNQTTPNPAPIVLGIDQDVTGIEFGNMQPPAPINSISGVKFKDLNGNGVRDGTEPGLFGWTITLSGPVSTSTQTDGNGTFEFTGLVDGTYTVCEVLQEDWTQTAPSSGPTCPDGSVGFTVTVSGGVDRTDLAFGNVPFEVAPIVLGSISGFKFEDINHNMVQDPGEGRVQGVTIFLDANGNNVLDAGEVSVVTDANGEFLFSGLSNGTFVVREVVQAGWIQITPNPAPIVLAAGQNVTGIVFGNQNFPATNSISGMKFNDLDGDGARDAGEPGLAGWTIYLDQNQNNALDMAEMRTVTDANGNYLFTNMLPGTYHVREVQQPDWTQTTANPAPIVLSAATVVTGVNFGNQEVVLLNSISGMKFNDLDGDGVQDAGEEGLAGWTITLSGAVSTSTQTDVDGMYEFTGLSDGTYTLCETLQAGWTQTFPTSGAACAGGTFGHSVSVSGGGSSINNNFGNRMVTGSISGFKWEDINHNQVQDPGEGRIAGITIYLDADNDGSLDAGEVSVVTGADGTYTFQNLAPGTYRVREVVQAGWIQITPNPGPITITVAGEDITGINFGNQNVAATNTISGMAYNDADADGVRDAGEVGLAGVTVYLDANGNNALDGGEVTTLTNGGGDYMFTNMLPGTYTVRAVSPAGATQTTANPASITVNSGTVVVSVNFGFDLP